MAHIVIETPEQPDGFYGVVLSVDSPKLFANAQIALARAGQDSAPILNDSLQPTGHVVTAAERAYVVMFSDQDADPVWADTHELAVASVHARFPRARQSERNRDVYFRHGSILELSCGCLDCAVCRDEEAESADAVIYRAMP